MKGSISTSTSIYHTRLPHQRKLENMAKTLDFSKQARLRLTWLTHYKKYKNASLTARRFGVSRTTIHKWVRRYADKGPRGLEDLSRTPKKKRISRVPWQTVDLIISIRSEYPAWSKHKISVILARDHGIPLSASTVGRILKRKGLYDKRVSDKRSRIAKRHHKRLKAEWWMKHAFPGCLIQVDTKHLYFAGRKYFQFTAVDCCSRVAFCRVFTNAGSASAKAFLEELTGYMPFAMVALQTDNGSEYLRHFDEATEKMLLTHYFSHPHCPKDNAFVERKIQTTKYELWAFKEACTLEGLNELADEWNHIYNNVRPHQSLDYLTPIEFLNNWMEDSKEEGALFTM